MLEKAELAGVTVTMVRNSRVSENLTIIGIDSN